MKHIYLPFLLVTFAGSCFGIENAENNCLRFVSNVPVLVTIISSTNPQNPFSISVSPKKINSITVKDLKHITHINVTKKQDDLEAPQYWNETTPTQKDSKKIDPSLASLCPKVCVINYNKNIVEFSQEEGQDRIFYDYKFDIQIRDVERKA